MNNIIYEEKARKKMRKLPNNIRQRIHNKVKIYASDPIKHQHMVKQIINTDQKRLRIGDWRVLFKNIGDNILIAEILPRGSAYRN